MDPTTTLMFLIDALIGQDKARAKTLCEDYLQWREKGGFNPTITGDELLVKLTFYLS